MNNRLILYPLCAQVLLTFVVWATLLFKRVNVLLKNKIHPQEVATEARALEIYKNEINLSDNLENLFELPILFYAAVIVIFMTGIYDQAFVNLAWIFVLFRTLHSIVHTTSNVIQLRFMTYTISSLVLWVMWLKIATSLLN